MSKILVGITQGDSNGIGYEVIIKALSDPRILEQFTPVIYGSSKIFSFYRKTIPEIEQMDTNAINNAENFFIILSSFLWNWDGLLRPF